MQIGVRVWCVLLLALTVSACADSQTPEPTRRTSAVVTPFHFSNRTLPAHDSKIALIPHLAVGNFECDHHGPGPCVPNAVLVLNYGSTDTTPWSLGWQPNQLLLGSAEGLRDHTDRLYAPGINLFDAATQKAFGASVAACVDDFDDDGYSDLVVINRSAPHRLYLNRALQPGYFDDLTLQLGEEDSGGGFLADGNHVLTGGTVYTSLDRYNTQAYSCTTGDINGDGLPDIIVGHTSFITTNMLNGGIEVGNPRSLQIFLNQGNGTFSDVSRDGVVIPQNPMARVGGVKLFDADGDGHLDLALGAGFKNESTPPSTTMMLYNNGQGVFATQETLPFLQWNASVDAATIDGQRLVFFVSKLPPHRVFSCSKVAPCLERTAEVFAGGNDQWFDPLLASGGAASSGRLVQFMGMWLLLVAGSDAVTDVHLFANWSGIAMTRSDGLISNHPAPAEDVVLVDGNADGILDMFLASTGFTLLYQSYGTVFDPTNRAPLVSDMDTSGSAADTNGDGRQDFVGAGFRNFHSSPMVRRQIRNQYYLGDQSRALLDASNQIPQPQTDNYNACAPACAADADPSLCMMKCDEYASCRTRCLASCGGQQSACLNACSWDTVRHRLYKDGCLAKCDSDCLTPQEPGYCPSGGELGTCKTTCNTGFDLDTVPWQRYYGFQHGTEKSFDKEMIEQVNGVLLFNYHNDPGGYADLFVVPTYQPPYLLLNNNGSYSLAEANRLPCFVTTLARGGAFAARLNDDDYPDLVLPYKAAKGLEVWENLHPQNAVDPLFAKRSITYSGWLAKYTKVYAATALHVNGDTLSDLALIVHDSSAGYQKVLLLINQGNWSFTVQEVLDLASVEVKPQCLNQLTNVVGDCAPLTIGASSTINITAADVDGDGKTDLVTAVDNSTPVSNQTRVGHLLLNRSSGQTIQFANVSSHLVYTIYDKVNLYSAWQPGLHPDASYYGMRMRAVSAANISGAGAPDLLITDFGAPVFLQNLGPACWTGGGSKCLEDRSWQVFGRPGLFDGKVVMKNYTSTVGDYDGDGHPDFMLHNAKENMYLGWTENYNDRQ